MIDGDTNREPKLASSMFGVGLSIQVTNSNTTSIAKFIVQRKENGKWVTIIDSKEGLNTKSIFNLYSINTVFGNNKKINYRILTYYIKNGKKYRYYTGEKTLYNSTSNVNNSSGNSNSNNSNITRVYNKLCK